jgi:hypothetical protein
VREDRRSKAYFNHLGIFKGFQGFLCGHLIVDDFVPPNIDEKTEVIPKS